MRLHKVFGQRNREKFDTPPAILRAAVRRSGLFAALLFLRNRVVAAFVKWMTA
jgi:hypothetical protein